MMQFDRNVSSTSLSNSSADNGQLKIDSSQAPATISIKRSSEITENPSTSEPSAISSRSYSSQPSGFISFFSNRQRKASGAPTISIVSVKQSRLMCVAKIDESTQAIDDLLDFHNRAIKAENKVSNALWHTVQYCKSRKSDSSSQNSSQGSYNGSQSNVHNSSFRGDNNVDSGISEMATESSPFPRSSSIQSASLSQAKQFLQCFVDANESRAKIATCRASFHKKVTTYQLQMISETLQRLRSLYIDLDTKLETYSSQLEADVRECWRKYAKYADNVTRLRTRLNSLLEKGMASKRKAIETAVNDLDGATMKLHMAHNIYTLSLITARQYHQWLVTHLQPCLYRNLNRCLRLVDYSVSYLLRLARIDQAPKGTFDFIAPPDTDPLGDTVLDTGLLSNDMGTLGEDTFRRAFPFDADLLVRAGDDSLQPDKIVVNQMTAYHVQKLLQNHMQEVSNQGSITQVLENEHKKLVDSLSRWISVLLTGGKVRDLPTTLKTDEALVHLLDEVEPLSPLMDLSSGESSVDAEKMYLGTATKPATLCALAIQLGTCEFFHCQSICFADSHAQIVRVLRQAEVVVPSPSPQPSSSTTSNILEPGNSSTTTNLLSPPPSSGFNSSLSSGLDILESRFHCLRVQLDSQEGSNSVGARSSICDSDSENDICVQPTSVNEVTAQPSSGQGNSTVTFVQAPQRRSIKSIKEESYRQSMTAFPKVPALTLTDNRSTNRHAAIAVSGGKILHRFQQNRIFKKDSTSNTNVGGSVSDAFLWSRTNSASSINQDLQTGTMCSVSVESIRPINGLSDEDLGHRMDQEDVDINKEPWFHGVLPRTEVVRLLQNQGDFLVRETSKAASTSYLGRHGRRHRGGTDAPSLNNLWAASGNSGATIGSPSSASTMSLLAGSQSTEDLCSNGVGSSNGKVVVTKMVLSVYWNGHKHFFIQGGNEAAEGSGDLGNRRGGWSFEEYEFPTLRDLIEYHVRTGKPVTQSSGAILLNPISRPDWQLDNRDVILLEKIGQGNFGEVHRGIYNGREVAVKTCRAGPAEVEIRRKFLQGEATALNFFHPNVVRLLGIAVRSHPIMIVMEYVAGGSLLSFLRRNGQTADIRTLLRMCVDAASGMAYLESKNCIHRDLAARNCLLTEERVLKIADFGMAREEHVYELSDRNGPIPIKWTAPEALYSNRYTSKCDVWSFGILLWEIFSAGDTPYHGLTNGETRDLVENGYRLTPPDRMPRQLGKYMLSCWHQNPNRRPTFSSLVISLSQLKREYFETSELSSPTDSGILSMPRQQISKPSQPDSPNPLETRENSRSGPSSSLTTPALTPTESQPSQINLNSPGSRLPRLKPVMVVSSEENDIQVELPVEKPCPTNSTATTTTTIVGVCPDGDDSF